MSFSAYTNQDFVSSNLSNVSPSKPSPSERSYSTVLEVSSDSSLNKNSSSSDEEDNHGKKSDILHILYMTTLKCVRMYYLSVSKGLEGELLRTKSSGDEAER